MDLQELVALGIVLFVFISVAIKMFYSHFAEPLSKWLLRKGYVKWAVWIRKKYLAHRESDRCH